jgi:hypothetical protein
MKSGAGRIIGAGQIKIGFDDERHLETLWNSERITRERVLLVRTRREEEEDLSNRDRWAYRAEL